MQLLTFVLLLPQTIYFIVFYNMVLTRKYSIFKTNIYAFALSILPALSSLWLIKIPPFNAYITTVFLAMIPILLYKGSLSERLIVYIVKIGIDVSLDLLTTMILYVFFNMTIDPSKPHSVERAIGLVIFHILNIILVFVQVKYIKNKKSIAIRFNGDVLLVCFTAMLIIILIPHRIYYSLDEGLIILTSVTFILIVIISFRLKGYIRMLVDKKNLDDNLKELEILYTKKVENYKEIEKNNLKIAKLNHDFNNHISVINILASRREYKKIDEYVDTLIKG